MWILRLVGPRWSTLFYFQTNSYETIYFKSRFFLKYWNKFSIYKMSNLGSFFSDTYCQLCERFITKEKWNKRLFSNRHIYEETYGFWTAYLPNRKLTIDKSFKLEKAFWRMFLFATRKIKVEEFWKKCFTIVTKLKDYDLASNKEFRKEFREILVKQFINDLYNKFISNEVKEKKSDFLDDRLDMWITVVSYKGPIQTVFMVITS